MPAPLRHRRLLILKHFLILLEGQLEKRAQPQLAQWVRFKQYLWWETSPEDFWKWSQALIETDIRLREIVQREMLLREEYERLAGAPVRNQVELYVNNNELVLLHEQYWRLGSGCIPRWKRVVLPSLPDGRISPFDGILAGI